jgi:hypothetical protein
MRKKIIEYFSKKIFKPQKTTGTEVITSFPPNVSKTNLEKALKDVNLKTLKMKGKMTGDFQKMEREIEPFRRKLRQTLQKMDDKPVTESGISKGKDMKAKGGRVGLKRGSFPDYSGDGKVTMKDILMGRGVIPKKKGKKKMMAKKTETPMQKAVKKNKNKKRII